MGKPPSNDSPCDNPGSHLLENEGVDFKSPYSFRDHHRELRDTVHPISGERVLLLTRKQLRELRLKELKDF
jgi:hypothetical protein